MNRPVRLKSDAVLGDLPNVAQANTDAASVRIGLCRPEGEALLLGYQPGPAEIEVVGVGEDDSAPTSSSSAETLSSQSPECRRAWSESRLIHGVCMTLLRT